jgi:hypothetical protein
MSARRTNGVSPKDTLGAEPLLGASRLRLLRVLLLHPGPPLHMRALGRLARAALGLLQRELKTFEEMGLVVRSEQARTVVFELNRAHPLLPSLRQIVLESAGGLGVWIAGQLAGLDPAALVYRVRDEALARPLVLLIVSEVAYERWQERTLPLELVLGRMILLRVLRPSQLPEPPDLSKWQPLPVRPMDR